MNEVIFSIIVPYYNAANTLKRLMDSIPGDPDIEVIVVDDKSTEDPEGFHFIKDHEKCDNRIYVSNTGKEKGCGAARNIGLKSARGRWVIFADADDFFLDGAFAEFRKYADSEADVIFFPPTSLKRDNSGPGTRHLSYEKVVRDYLISPTSENERKVRYKYYPAWSKMFRRSLLEINRIFFEEIPICEDMLFSAKTGLTAGKIECSSKPVYCVTESKTHLIKERNKRFEIWKARVTSRHTRFLREHIGKELSAPIELDGRKLMNRVNRKYYDPILKIWIFLILKTGKVKMNCPEEDTFE